MHSSVRAFKSNLVEARFTSFIVAVCVLAMRVLLFLHSGFSDMQPHHFASSFLGQYIAPFFANPWVSFTAATVCVFVIAWIIAELNNRFTLIRTRTNLPFIVPLFLFSLHPYFLMMTPDYLSVIFILLALFPLLYSYQQYRVPVYSFKSAVLISIAGVFQPYALLLLLLWWRGDVVMRGIHFKSVFSFLMGVLLVFWIVFCVYLFFENIDGFVEPFYRFAEFSLPALPHLSVFRWILIAGIVAFFLSNMILSYSLCHKAKVLTQNIIRFIIFILSGLFISQIVYWQNGFFWLALSIALVSFLIAYFYSTTYAKAHIYGAYINIAALLAFYATHWMAFFSSI